MENLDTAPKAKWNFRRGRTMEKHNQAGLSGETILLLGLNQF